MKVGSISPTASISRRGSTIELQIFFCFSNQNSTIVDMETALFNYFKLEKNYSQRCLNFPPLTTKRKEQSTNHNRENLKLIKLSLPPTSHSKNPFQLPWIRVIREIFFLKKFLIFPRKEAGSQSAQPTKNELKRSFCFLVAKIAFFQKIITLLDPLRNLLRELCSIP